MRPNLFLARKQVGVAPNFPLEAPLSLSARIFHVRREAYRLHEAGEFRRIEREGRAEFRDRTSVLARPGFLRL